MFERKNENCFWKCTKHCGKRRKCWLPAFSPFPTMFLKAVFLGVEIVWERVKEFNPFPNKPWFFLHVSAAQVF